MTMLFSQTATLLFKQSSTGVDDMGIPIGAPPVELQVPCWYEAEGSTEPEVNSAQTITGYRLYLPLQYAAQLRSCDSVILDFDPDEYEVEGKVGVVPDGFIVSGCCIARISQVRS